MRSIRLGLLAAVVATSLFATTAPAHAANPGFTGNGQGLTGTAGDDLLILFVDGVKLAHNRFAQGDPGFASNTDFDTSTAGVQTLDIGYGVGFSLGAGNDTVRLVGTFQSGNVSLPDFGFGDGTDTLDMTEFAIKQQDGTTRGIRFGAGSSDFVGPNSLERLIGTAHRDEIITGVVGSDAYPALTYLAGYRGDDLIIGSVKGETIDAGDGNNTVEAGDGDDTVIVSPPFTQVDQHLWGGAGNDTLRVQGTDGNDFVASFSVSGYTTFLTESRNSEDAYQTSDFESVQFDMGGGSDSLYIEPTVAAVTLNGGASEDHVIMGAQRFPGTLQGDTYRVPGLPDVVANGFENRALTNTLTIAAGAGPGGNPHVRTFDWQGQPKGASFYAYGEGFHGGVHVAMGDLDGDGLDELITAPGPGGGPHIRVFDQSGEELTDGFYAYGANFAGGVHIAAGDLDQDGVDEIITVPQSGGGPHVRVFDALGELLTEFFAPGFADTGLFVGTAGTPSGTDEIIIGSGAGAAPRVATFNGDGEATAPAVEPFPNAFRGGVRVAGFEPTKTPGYRNGVLVGAGPGGNPHVRTFIHNSATDPLHPVGSFYAYNEGFNGGVYLAGGTLGFGSPGAVVVGAGPGGGPHIRQLSPTGVGQPLSFYAFGANFTGGIDVAVSAA